MAADSQPKPNSFRGAIVLQVMDPNERFENQVQIFFWDTAAGIADMDLNQFLGLRAGDGNVAARLGKFQSVLQQVDDDSLELD